MATRRNVRLRREYLYRKQLETNERVIYDKKKKLKQAIETGKPIPTELRAEEAELRHQIELDDERSEIPWDPMDDEYGRAGEFDPRVMVSTSRDPSSRLVQFAKEVCLLFPNSQRINRGNYTTKEIVDACRKNEVTDLVLVHEHRGEPDGLVITHMPHGPTAFFGLMNVVTRHDVKIKETISEAYPHLIFDNFTTKLGLRTQNILKHLFPVPKDENKRVVTFANRNDFISFRHHMYEKTSHKEVELKELGPRFEMRLFQIRLGTLEQTEAQNEYVYRPYLSNSKTKNLL
ncbi:hypothetical protein GUITHDRAFT_159282 [Guillardia theta CCMP2712]|uniref:Brix domain-containing protein n=2 Tax=Guillardia theta TaxID=55529 RepID=L1JVZ3_GUITC|nr:hypothetical protein GUITHDRAFT_159282 [Guillardia theta CCMP2712]EKX52355.1 hypothetical protein GUITHDRAFT_159282 [Guillardia theta CCMP2712]|eukprot:XP_005839335.1 hypothetical protein GUITHDRAFT_159282 [Guillardia theta CCMP2712]